MTGLVVDSELIGIDYRVQDGELYGVGDAGGVYMIDPRAARPREVTPAHGRARRPSFGVDFNPAADRLRVVSDTGQNLRHDVNAGGTTDDGHDAELPAGLAVATGVTGAAYTNNDLDPTTATTLFDLDTASTRWPCSRRRTPASSATGKLGVDAARGHRLRHLQPAPRRRRDGRRQPRLRHPDRLGEAGALSSLPVDGQGDQDRVVLRWISGD